MSNQRFDAVFTYHRNIHTCGVARFNHYLASYLSVPLLNVTDRHAENIENSLVSIKFAEISATDVSVVVSRIQELPNYSLILHDYTDSPSHLPIIERADVVMGLNSEIVARLREFRPDAVVGFTVSSYEAPPPNDNPDLRLITFGMAHKIQSDEYRRVAELLVVDSRSHLLEISCALHEGTQFDDSFFEVGDEISKFFDGRVRFLGFLADSEVSLRVSQASAMLAFFPSGARENNNSIMSAMALGCPVVTNLDDRSPSWLEHGMNVFDLRRLSKFPSTLELQRVGEAGRSTVAQFTYGHLLEILTKTSD